MAVFLEHTELSYQHPQSVQNTKQQYTLRLFFFYLGEGAFYTNISTTAPGFFI